MTLRPATADDAEVVSELEARVFDIDAWSEESVLAELTGEHRTAFVALLEGFVVGYAVTMATGDSVDLHRIAVHPDHRRQGLARELLAAVGSSERMLLEVRASNKAAQAFYEAEGFTEIDRRRHYYLDGSDAVVMERPRSSTKARRPEWRL